MNTDKKKILKGFRKIGFGFICVYLCSSVDKK